MRCKFCKEVFIVRYFNQKFCSGACRNKAPKPVKKVKVVKAIKKPTVKKVLAPKKNKAYYTGELQRVINRIARLIDRNLTCLARGCHGTMHSGHVYPKSRHANMRFNLHNIHRQSEESNMSLQDDLKMLDGIIGEYGIDYKDFLEKLKHTATPKMTIPEIQLLTSKGKLIWSRLFKDGTPMYNFVKRIELRNEINLELGIYPPSYCQFKLK